MTNSSDESNTAPEIVREAFTGSSQGTVYQWLENSTVAAILFTILPLLLGGVFLFAVRILGAQNFDVPISVTLLVAFAIYISCILALQFVIRQMREFRSEVIGQVEKRNSALSDDIDRKLSTTIIPLAGKAMLREAVTEAYRAATKQAKIAESRFSFNKNVMYFGAASISPTVEESRDAESRDDYSETDVAKYEAAFNEMGQAGISLSRYVRFFEIPSFGRRDSSIRTAYIAWLKVEIQRLEEHNNYTLIDTRRAPRWKSPRNFIIAADTYLDISGGGTSGFKIKGESFCGDIMESTLNFINERHEDEETQARYYKSNVSLLKNMLANLESFHEQRLAEEQAETYTE